jgi:hypothetical protein
MIARWFTMMLGLALIAAGCAREAERPAVTPAATPAAAHETTPEPMPPLAEGESAHTIGKTAAGAALATKVKMWLIESEGLAPDDLDVEATPEGEVTLEGSVAAEEQRRRIEDAVLAIEGVSTVENGLSVAR